MTGKYNGADIAWMIVATAMVFLMTPALAFFYGGMVHRKNVISTMIKSLIAAGVVSILWVMVGYSLCFGQDIGGVIGNPMTHFFFKGVNSGHPGALRPAIPLPYSHFSNSCLQSSLLDWWWEQLQNVVRFIVIILFSNII